MELVPCIGDPECCAIPVDARSLLLGIELSSPAHRAGLQGRDGFRVRLQRRLTDNV
jgi:hypothetical protein